MKFYYFWPPLGKSFLLPLEKFTVAPHLGKNPSDAHVWMLPEMEFQATSKDIPKHGILGNIQGYELIVRGPHD